MDQATKLRAIADKKKGGRLARGPLIIAVTSGKGGVGKTHLAVNLSLFFLQQGFQVGLLDADLGMANVDVALGINPQYNLQHVFFHGLSLKEIITQGPMGLQFIPGASGSKDLATLSEERLLSFIQDWKEFTYELDYLFIDTSPGISNAVTGFIHSCDETIVVCTPDPLSITDAYSMVKVIGNTSQRPLHLVMNRSIDYRITRGMSQRMVKTVKKYLGLEMNILGIIPEDSHVLKALNRQRPVLLEYPSCKASLALGSICKEILKDRGAREERSESRFIYRLVGLFRK